MTKKLQQAVKTKNQTAIKTTLQNLLIIIGAILIFIAPLIHIEFSKKNQSVVEFKKNFNKKFDELKAQKLTTTTLYKNGDITASEKIIQDDLINLKETKLSKKYKNELREVTDNNRIFGWKTTRIFLVGFGIRLPYLMFSLIISFLIFKIGTKEKKLQQAFIFLQIASYTISFYVIIWCFWYSQDYPLSAYRITVIALSGLVATFTVYYIQYREIFKLRLQKIVDALSRFAFIEVKKKYIKQPDKESYIKDIRKTLKKGME